MIGLNKNEETIILTIWLNLRKMLIQALVLALLKPFQTENATKDKVCKYSCATANILIILSHNWKGSLVVLPIFNKFYREKVSLNVG